MHFSVVLEASCEKFVVGEEFAADDRTQIL